MCKKNVEENYLKGELRAMLPSIVQRASKKFRQLLLIISFPRK